ncbi:MAG: extracellular solute-binding protein [Clostridia bacterium]|nr:extracellular solute-binding protein [Clostridia bacterium]
MLKRIISAILLASMLTAGLTACGTEETAKDTSAPVSGNPSDSAQDDTEPPPETEPLPDYTDFTFPEETDTLVVYTSGMLSQTLNPAVKIFKEMYPEVTVDVRNLSEEEHQTLLQTEIPAGGGPDLLFSYGIDLPDIYKTMTTGVFTDLNYYLYNDEEFRFEDYIQGVFTGGQIAGRQYMVPIQVQMPVVLTTMEILEENGIKPEQLATYEGFLDACVAFKNNNPDSDLLDFGAEDAFLVDLYDLCGLNFIDYAANTISMDKEALNKLVDVSKLYYNPNIGERVAEGALSSFVNRKYMIRTYPTNSFLMVNDSAALLKFGNETPYLTLVPDPYGGTTANIMTVAAIPEGSPNKLNAYRLLKILLSEDVQYGANAILGMPVHIESIRKNFASSVEKNRAFEFDVTTEDYEPLIEKMQNITRAFVSPAIIRRYLKLEMQPYLTGTRSFDDCFDNLKNTIELYKDE